MPEVERVGYLPGLIGRVTEMHGTYYNDIWNMGVQMEAKIAEGLAEFLCRYDPSRDGLWIVRDGGQVVGAIAIDGMQAESRGARLRWFILLPDYQGCGLGHRMLKDALDFCRAAAFRKVYLTTFAGLDAARHLYEQAGFRLVDEKEGTSWGKQVTEQVFELDL